MELLILGIDGGDQKIIEAFDMPFLKGLISKSATRPLYEDFTSRGWSQILTGKKAHDAKNMYMRPLLDGTNRFSFSYNSNDMYDRDNVLPLMDLVRQHGKKIGIMNVPTTSPAHEVDGFLVAGGGGGMGSITTIPEHLYYPDSVLPYLEGNNYIFDVRFKSSGIKKFSEFIKKLNEVIEIRTKTYLELCEEFSPDIGFLCYRVTTDVQYLAMSEIQAYIASNAMPELSSPEGGRVVREIDALQAKIAEHYSALDKCIERVFSVLNPSDYIITSDHGAEPFLYTGNLDAFLQEKGYQDTSSPGIGLKKKCFDIIRQIVPVHLRKKLRKNTPLKKIQTDRFSISKTRAFGHDYVRGMYVNDRVRFGGPVELGQELDLLVDEIIKEFNADYRAQEIGLKARAYRREYTGTPYCDYLPDIYIDGPGSIYYTSKGEFIERNPFYGPLDEDLSCVHRDMYTGQKGTKPLFFISSDLEGLLDTDDSLDLTLVYKLVARHLDKA